jgi:hypothetical protein
VVGDGFSGDSESGPLQHVVDVAVALVSGQEPVQQFSDIWAQISDLACECAWPGCVGISAEELFDFA